MEKVSIIIPAYNEANYIEKTLDSINNQDYPSIETIVICNGCTDNSESIINKYKVKLISIKEKDTIKAKNLGALKAASNNLIFLDADVIFKDNNTIENIANEMQNPIIGTCKLIPNNDRFDFVIFSYFRNLFSHLGMSNGILFCKKDLFEKVNGFTKFPAENHELIKKLKKHGKFKVLSKEVIISMRRYEKLGYVKVISFWLTHIFLKKQEYKSIR